MNDQTAGMDFASIVENLNTNLVIAFDRATKRCNEKQDVIESLMASSGKLEERIAVLRRENDALGRTVQQEIKDLVDDWRNKYGGDAGVALCADRLEQAIAAIEDDGRDADRWEDE